MTEPELDADSVDSLLIPKLADLPEADDAEPADAGLEHDAPLDDLPLA